HLRQRLGKKILLQSRGKAHLLVHAFYVEVDRVVATPQQVDFRMQRADLGLQRIEIVQCRSNSRRKRRGIPDARSERSHSSSYSAKRWKDFTGRNGGRNRK